MKYLVLLVLSVFMFGCSPNNPSEFVFGDTAYVVSGPYRGSKVQIFNQINDEYKRPCKVHQYYAQVTRKGLSKADYVCHEDLEITHQDKYEKNLQKQT